MVRVCEGKPSIMPLRRAALRGGPPLCPNVVNHAVDPIQPTGSTTAKSAPPEGPVR